MIKMVHIIFSKEVKPLDGKQMPFREATFHDVHYAHRGVAGLQMQFSAEGPEYFYPWHSIDRVKFA